MNSSSPRQEPNLPGGRTPGAFAPASRWLLLVLAVAIFILQAAAASPHKSASFDEQYHLSAGYAYLRTGDFRLATTHPPLIALLSALGLLSMDNINLPLDHPSWEASQRFEFSDVFLWEANDQSVAMVQAARLPLIALGAVLVVVAYLWSRRLFGEGAAWLVVFLIAFEPNLVANSRIIATDMGLTVFLFLAMWRLWHWRQDPSPRQAVLVGIFAGAAMAAKYTGLIFWPVAILAVLVSPLKSPVRPWRIRLTGLLIAGVAALATLWAVYRFDIGWVTAGPLPVPIPALFYWQNLSATYLQIVFPPTEEYVFLLGEASARGSWLYFLVALIYKTPIGLLILSAAGIIAMLRRQTWRELGVLWAMPAAFLVLGSTGVLTIGFRHFLPAIPFLAMFAGYTLTLAQPAERHRTLFVAAIVVLALSVAASSLRVYPHQEAYFNELAGRWTNWSNILVDSNIDWGQDLPALRDRMDELGIERINLAYFGKSVPEKYGVQYAPLYGFLRFMEGYELDAYNPYTPEPGWYAISATSLRLGLLTATRLDLYAFFRDRTPDARAGYSIYLYNVAYPPDAAVTPTVVTGRPVADLSPQELGVAPGSRVQAKWRRTDETAVLSRQDAWTPPAGYGPVAADFAGVFTLDGYEMLTPVPAAGDTLRLRLYWRRGDAPMPMPAPTKGRPLSAFVHLIQPETGQTVAQYDGWDVALRGLEEGDLIVQEAQLDLPLDMPPGQYTLRAGLYSPQSGVRLIMADAAAPADQVDLASLTVEESVP